VLARQPGGEAHFLGMTGPAQSEQWSASPSGGAHAAAPRPIFGPAMDHSAA
jgi:hypothetical protein